MVTGGADGNANDRGYVPVTLLGLGSAHQEDNGPHNGTNVAQVAEPQTVLGLRLPLDLLRTHVHPEVGHHTAQLLTDERSNDRTQELETQLLRVELELVLEQCRDLDSRQDVAQKEDHSIGSRGDHHAGIHEHRKRPHKFVPGERSWVNPTQLQIFSLPRRLLGIGLAVDVSGLGAKEQVQNELDAVDL